MEAHDQTWVKVNTQPPVSMSRKISPGRYPRLQILTVAELLDGKKILFPEHRVETFAKAERNTKHEQDSLVFSRGS